MRGLNHAQRRSHPASDLLLHPLIRPVPYDNLPLDSHTAHNMSILPVPMRRLVLIHEVHINRVIRKFLIELCMQMTQRFPKFLQPQDPHLRRGEGMHPCDNTRTVRIIVGIIEGLADRCLADQCGP